MIRRLLSVLCIALFISACEKDEIPGGNSSTPIFNYNLSLSGQEYLISAGLDSLSLLPTTAQTDSSLIFSSVLSNQDCVPCGVSVVLEITSPAGYEAALSSSIIDDFQGWDFSFTTAPDSVLTFNLALNTGFEQIPGFWFLDGAPVLAAASANIDVPLPTPGNYRISFDPEPPGCHSSPDLEINFVAVSDPCYGTIIRPTVGVDSFYVSLSPAFDMASINFRWFSGDSTLAENNFGIFSQGLDGLDNVCVEVSDSNNCIITSCLNLENPGSTCQPNIFVDSFSERTVAMPDIAAGVVIQFFDDQGNEFTSENAAQEASFFQLLSAEHYSDPAFPNMQFAKLTIEMSCKVVDQNGFEHALVGQLVTAVEIP